MAFCVCWYLERQRIATGAQLRFWNEFMLRIGEKTIRAKRAVIEAAKSYFSLDGVGLETQTRGPLAIALSSGGNFVLIQVNLGKAKFLHSAW